MDLFGQFGYSPQLSRTNSKSLKVELLTWEVSDDSHLHLSTSTILLSYRVASGESLCIRKTFLRGVTSESLVGSGASGWHRPLSTSTQSKTPLPEREFIFYAPQPPDPHGGWGVSRCNLFFFLMPGTMVQRASYNSGLICLCHMALPADESRRCFTSQLDFA